VSVEYRKAPEFPWPAGPADALAVAGGSSITPEPSSEATVIIGGESAGEYLTAAVALRSAKSSCDQRVDGVNLKFGVYDFGLSPSQRDNAAHDGFDVLSPQADAIDR